jgi:protocatechuate 3,4-dioxygenase beta subunit
MRHGFELAGLVAFLILLVIPAGYTQEKPPPPLKPDQIAPVNAPAEIAMAGKAELGERLMVTGTITGPDGKIPVRGASIYAYHTDANGRYDPTEARPTGNARLRGFMRSDARGHYAFSTIRPAPYPNAKIPAHVHFIVSITGYKDLWLEMLFSDDPLITDEHRAAVKEDRLYKFAICQVTKDANAVWHCTQNIALKPN